MVSMTGRFGGRGATGAVGRRCITTVYRRYPARCGCFAKVDIAIDGRCLNGQAAGVDSTQALSTAKPAILARRMVWPKSS